MWYDKCLWDWELGPIILYDNVYNTVANLSVKIYHTISKIFFIHYTILMPCMGESKALII